MAGAWINIAKSFVRSFAEKGVGARTTFNYLRRWGLSNIKLGFGKPHIYKEYRFWREVIRKRQGLRALKRTVRIPKSLFTLTDLDLRYTYRYTIRYRIFDTRTGEERFEDFSLASNRRMSPTWVERKTRRFISEALEKEYYIVLDWELTEALKKRYRRWV